MSRSFPTTSIAERKPNSDTTGRNQHEESTNSHSRKAATQLPCPIPEDSLERLRRELLESSKDLDEEIVHARAKTRLSTKLHVLVHRGSQFRGVSKNGGKWQALLMIN